MGWSHPDISLPDLVLLVKGFVEIIVLASGYQSSGVPAHWDTSNVKKALLWALFFEEVFQRFVNSADYQDSVKELDAALLELTSDPLFPPGLASFSSSTLVNARDFVVERIVNALPLRDDELHALLSAVVEIDFNDLKKVKEPNPLEIYTNKLLLYNKKKDKAENKGESAEKSEKHVSLGSNIVHNRFSMADKGKNNLMGAFTDVGGMSIRSDIRFNQGHSEFVLEELVKKNKSISCVSSLEAGLDILLEMMARSARGQSFGCIWKKQACESVNKKMEKTVTYNLWNQWQSGCLLYLLDERTLNLISGVRLIFHSGKNHWFRAFESLKDSSANCDLLEMIELCLLGAISMSNTWKQVIECFTSCSYEVLPISKLYHDVHTLRTRRSQPFDFAKQPTANKETDILEYLSNLLDGKLFLLWKLPPVLVASGIPSWSPLFHIYVDVLEKQMIEGSPTARLDYSICTCSKHTSWEYFCSRYLHALSRYCNCHQHDRDHSDCEIAERAWCIYVRASGLNHIH